MNFASSAYAATTPEKRNLSPTDFAWAARALDCEVAWVRAVDDVESRGDGFHANGEPKILFERHIFYRELKKKFNTAIAREWMRRRPDICNTSSGNYTGGRAEHDRLHQAVQIDRECALKSASWGRYQIMGFNYEHAGYAGLQAFINAMYRSERSQLNAFVNFLQNTGLDHALQRGDERAFAKGYNGRLYWKNNYHGKLRNAYRRHS